MKRKDTATEEVKEEVKEVTEEERDQEDNKYFCVTCDVQLGHVD